MKKPFALFIIICCYLTVSAQQSNIYQYRLDSIRYGDDAKEIFQYDDRLNCIEIKTILPYIAPNYLFDIKTFTYDDENRIIRTDYEQEEGCYKEIHEYSYNDYGLVAEDICSVYYEFYTHEEHKLSRYEYGEEQQLIDFRIFDYTSNGTEEEHIHTHYEYENGLLMTSSLFYWDHDYPDRIKTYTYDNGGLCIETIETDGIREIERTTLIYDEDRHLASQTVQGFNYNNNWAIISKKEYSYDTNGNCTTADYEDYNSGNHTQLILSYDQSIRINEIAGIMNRWDFDFTPNNMVLDYYRNDLGFGTSAGPITFHYSRCDGVEETTENQVLIWPNPVSEELRLDPVDAQYVAIYTLDGRLVLSSEATETLNVKDLPTGCYLLIATSPDGRQRTQRIVKKRVD